MYSQLVSIILPVYNGETYLSQSIESCLNQTYRNIELIIVNDCSTDDTLAIAKQFQAKDDRVIIINNPTNKRLPASLNIGHSVAKGDFFTWTSDDNLYLPTAIESMIHEIDIQHSDFVYADFIQINKEGRERRRFYLEEPEELLWRNVIGACFLYRKEVFVENEGYDESLFMVEDYDFWLRAFMKFKFYHIKQTLYKYRIHSDSLTSELNDNNSEKTYIYEENKYKMFSKTFEKYLFPKELQYLILRFQKSNQIDYMKIWKHIKLIKNFYKKIEMSNYISHVFYLKNKFISGVREKAINQGVFTFIQLIVLFGRVMTINDYKTGIKILTHKIFRK